MGFEFKEKNPVTDYTVHETVSEGEQGREETIQ